MIKRHLWATLAMKNPHKCLLIMVGNRPIWIRRGADMAKVVMVVGPCGAGKSSALGRMRHVLGSRVGEVAVLETDTTYMMIDPTWSCYTSRYAAIARRIAARITSEFVREGFDWVAIGSNGLQDPSSINDFVAELASGIEVHHVFLDPSVSAVQARIAARAHPLDDHKTPGWLEENVNWMRSYHDTWSALIDNSDLDVDETVDAIYATVQAGAGRITHRLPTPKRIEQIPLPSHPDSSNIVPRGE
jgi:energy-coupling factor transporter ATP-binding protein EcfA2